MVEHARNLAGVVDAVHDEYGVDGTSIISLLDCSLDGRRITVDLTPGSRMAAIHASTSVVEHTTCNYGLRPAVQQLAASHGLVIAGIDDTGEVRAVERADHPFFVATLYQPQLQSAPGRPHPLLAAFVDAILER